MKNAEKYYILFMAFVCVCVLTTVQPQLGFKDTRNTLKFSLLFQWFLDILGDCEFFHHKTHLQPDIWKNPSIISIIYAFFVSNLRIIITHCP